MNFYNISQVPDRLQTAQHFHSSLQEPTLDNIEAQLFVARQRNYQLSQQYFQNKYGNSQLYNNFVQTNNLEGLGPPKQQVYDLKRELDKKALQIQEQQMRKINARKNMRNNLQEGNNEDYKIVNKKKNQKKNIWEKEENNVQYQQQQQNVSKPLQINLNEQKQSVFISDFKNYLANKKKFKEEISHSKLQANSKLQASSKLQANSKIQGNKSNSEFKKPDLSLSRKDETKKDEKCYEQQLVKKIFREVVGKTDKSARIQKIQFIQYLNSNKKILKVLGITPQEVSTTVIAQTCKDSNIFSPSDALIWVLGCLGKVQEIKRLKAQHQFENVPSGCMLSTQLMQLFESTFRLMDRHNDLIIKRVPFIARLTSQPLVKKNLNLPAVFEPQYNRQVSLRRIFQRIEIQTLLCSQQERKLNEYLSWNQFISYFQSGHKQRGKYDLIVLVESLKNEEKFGFSYLPQSVSEIIALSFKKIDQGEQMFNTLEVINQIKCHKDYEVQKYTFIKQGQEDGNVASQTFEDVLSRIKETGLKFVNPKQFLQYFSARGKPIEQYQTQKQNTQTKQLAPTKVTFIENQLFPQQEEPNGYDSDPQIYNNSKLRQMPNEFRRSQKQFKNMKQTSKSFYQGDLQSKNNDRSQLKVTIPQPFSFEYREKERQLAKSQQKSLQTIPQSSQFKAKPIPSKVAEVGLFQKMISEQQKKNQERKRSSMIITLANQRPFSFQNRKFNRKTKQQRQDFIFKAKPIPWFCSVDLLARKKQEQIVRNQRIAKAAQQSLAKAKLPPRMEKDHLQKQVKKVVISHSKPRQSQSLIKAKEPPNFQRIHKQFELALQCKRKQNKTTQIKQFKFSSTSKDNISKIKPNNSQIQQLKQQKNPYVPPNHSNVDIFAQSTAKFLQQVEKRRKEMEEKRKKQAQLKLEEQERQKVDEQLKKKVQLAANINKENKEKEEQAKRKEQNAKQMATFKQWKNQRIEKARQQPLLVDRITKRDEKIERMKKLWEVSQTLKKNGITGKEHDHYFKRQQLLLIMDYKELKDKIDK